MAITFKRVKAELAAVNVSIYRIDGEYKVYPKGTIGQAYFTDDLMDAYGTGMMISGHDEKLADIKAQRQAAVLAAIVTPLSVTIAHVKAGNAGSVTVTLDNGRKRTYRVAPNAWGNWYAYFGCRKVQMFFGDFVDQSFEAADWLRKAVTEAR